MKKHHRTRRGFLKAVGLGAAALAAPLLAAGEAKAKRKPNFIIFFTDDLGYSDVGCFGSSLIRTPNFDRMAAEGMRLTNFYAQAVCGPSRAALMTGCYPIRVGEPGNQKNQHTVLHPKEITLAEILKGAGYATACIGKWHLAGGGAGGRGRGPYKKELMPTAQGFDSFFGTPSHNGTTREVTERYVTELMRDSETLESPTDMDQLTTRYTAEAVRFIRANKERPFFLYLAHNMPHVPLGVSEKFKGKSKRGRFGDVIEELDWSAGQILSTLKELDLDEDTLIVFTSDNGPWVEGHLAGAGGIDTYYGSADPLRGYKMTTWDGGPRVPGIVRWPGKVPAGKVCDEIVCTMDLLPTFAALAGAKAPGDRIIDGKDQTALLTGRAGATGRETFLFFCFTHLQAVRRGKWKLVLPRPARPPWTGWSARMVDAVEATQLYDLEADVAEKHDVAEKNPDVVADLMKLVEQARADLGDYDRIGAGARFFDEPAPKAGDPRGRLGQGRKPQRPGGKSSKVEYDHPEPVGNLRFGFESGGMEGWRVVEGSFEVPVSDRPRFHHLNGMAKYNKQGKFFLTTLEQKGDDKGKDAQTGVIESPVFVLAGTAMSFLVGGGKHADTYVALCDADGGKELQTARGAGGEAMRRINWDVAKFKGRKLFLRVVDRHTAGWGHVTFDDFSTEGKIDAEATAQRWEK